MKEKVDIIMATYNGAKYLKQQINSILSQTYENWTLYIHDDGSTDITCEILREFTKKDKRIILIEDEIKFRNAGDNFKHLLRFTTSKLICFCDQDDIWFENKLEILVNNFRINNCRPYALLSAAYIYESDSNLIKGILNYEINQLSELLFINGGLHGCRSMINQSMKNEILRNRNNHLIHDHVMSLIACSFGEIEFIPDILFLYRQHNKNLSGKIEMSIIKRILRFLKTPKKFVIDLSIFKGIEDFYYTYNKSLSLSDKKSLQDYLSMPRKSKLLKMFLVIKNRYKRNSSNLKLLILILTKKYIGEHSKNL